MEGDGEAVVILTDVDESEVKIFVFEFFESAVFFQNSSVSITTNAL